ncbi:hypothetical protein EDD84_27545 [Burkholderia gladioli]|nr:hypothetical protein EDD84_27545 [Burkholderia gladioli]
MVNTVDAMPDGGTVTIAVSVVESTSLGLPYAREAPITNGQSIPDWGVAYCGQAMLHGLKLAPRNPIARQRRRPKPVTFGRPFSILWAHFFLSSFYDSPGVGAWRGEWNLALQVYARDVAFKSRSDVPSGCWSWTITRIRAISSPSIFQ